jgi:thimet oligopeptidase
MNIHARASTPIVAILAFVLASLCSSGAVAVDIPADSPIAEALRKAEASVMKIIAIPDEQRTFENTVGAMDDVLVTLDNDTSMTQFMMHVSTKADEREAGAVAEEHYNNWLIELYKREPLYNAVKAYVATAAYSETTPELEGERARLLKFVMRDFRRAGMELPAEKREELKTLQKEISKLQIDFSRNLAADDTRLPFTRDELAGVPDAVIDRQPKAADVYLLGMDYPSFLPVLDFARSEDTRKKTWIAYKRRGGQKNVELLEKILTLRAREAELLGYESQADFQTEIRMAKTAAEVKAFFERLRPLVRVKAQQDYDQLLAMKRAETGDADATLQPWDQSYYTQRVLETEYAVDSEKVREYFPLEKVTDGLFSITQSLYGLEYKDITEKAKAEGRPMWHADVKLFEVWDKETGEMLGEFYLDLHPRENKYTHAAQWGLKARKRWPDGTIQKPLAALVCNFTKPTDTQPSLLSHDEVETYFHEFGHCLHTILTEAEVGRFAGTSVEGDFVEAPSQMFEEWVWNADVLRTFARHYKSGEPIPSELIDGMVAARNVGSGLLAEHQFYYALTDLAYHMDDDGKVDTTQLALDLFREVELFEPVENTFYQASFGHLVNPGYVAGYYGYQWSRVYACDMFERFKELGMLDPQAGQYYRDKILARGGTLDGMDLVRGYLGREPDMQPYLEYLGLETDVRDAN